MGRKIIYGRSQGNGVDRPSEPSLRLVVKNGHGQVRISIPKDVGVEAGTRAHLWFSEEFVHFGVSFEEGGRLKVHGPKGGNGSLLVLGSVDDKSFAMLKGHRWEFSDIERLPPFHGNIMLPTTPTGITFIGVEGSTPIHDPIQRKKRKKQVR